jgi:8-amino-3,8-dideoxy-alpha-D-manno-octulosonate transaminase
MQVAAKLPAQLANNCPDYAAVTLPRSDHIMGRTICMQIKLTWSSNDIAQRIDAIEKVFNNL